MRKSKSEKVYCGFCIGICVFVALISLYPLLYTLFMSITTGKELDANGGYVLFFPKKPVLTAYQQIFMSSSYVWHSLWITFCRTVVATFATITVCSLTGYALSRPGLPGKRPYMIVMLIPMLFSGGLIPGYLNIQELGLLNNFWVMVLPGVFSAYNVLIFKQFFEGIPRELEEAAEVDGTSEVRLFWQIVLPMSKPVMSAIGLFTVVGNWNTWFDAFLYIQPSYSNLWPLQTYITLMFNNIGGTTNADIADWIQQVNEAGLGISEMTYKMALTIVSIIPVLVIYPFFQKYFTRGVYLGAVKG